MALRNLVATALYVFLASCTAEPQQASPGPAGRPFQLSCYVSATASPESLSSRNGCPASLLN